jgi:hypothetical protein
MDLNPNPISLIIHLVEIILGSLEAILDFVAEPLLVV